MKKVLIILALVLVIGLISWAGTVGIIKLITMCFGWKFSLKMATGIWLILGLVSGAVKANVNK